MGALLAYRTGPDQDVFTTNQITSALVAYRSAADQDTATASSIAAALLSYYTIAQVDGLLAGKLGVAEAASALQIAVRFPDDGAADEAAIGEQILAPTDVLPSDWTVRPQRLQRGLGHAHRGRLHPDPGGEPVEHCAHLQLDSGPRAPLCLVPPGGIAKLHFGAFGGSIPGLVQQSAGTTACRSGPALTGSATLDGLTAQGNVGCDQLLCNDVNCTDVFTTDVDALGAVSEHQRRGQRGPAKLRHRNFPLTINNTATPGTSPRWATCPREH